MQANFQPDTPKRHNSVNHKNPITGFFSYRYTKTPNKINLAPMDYFR